MVLTKVHCTGPYRHTELSSVWYNTPVPSNRAGEEQRDSRFFFSLFFFLPPSADTAQNRTPTIKIDH
ncbi:hypothetical protein GW17_00038090 [Ensete ventricosum]|nr:hypothetical protein GW17_00038090 [Ensete ventricosum]